MAVIGRDPQGVRDHGTTGLAGGVNCGRIRSALLLSQAGAAEGWIAAPVRSKAAAPRRPATAGPNAHGSSTAPLTQNHICGKLRRELKIQSANTARACDVIASTAGWVSLRSALMA